MLNSIFQLICFYRTKPMYLIMLVKKIEEEGDPKSETYLDEDALQIKQPNVPPHDLSHRKAVIDYYRQKMRTTQFIL